MMCIHFVIFIMLLVWAFSAGTPVSKANWAKATLIFMLIGFVLVILFWGSIVGLVLSNMLTHVNSNNDIKIPGLNIII